MAEKKPSNRERIKEIVTGIETGIQDLFQSDKFADYLRTMSRFHSYSYNNTILIHMQMPNATHVAGFNKWKNQFERHVKKGEKGLTIIAPTPFKKRIEEMKLDPDTKAPILDPDGNVIMEEREIEIPLFRPVKVFDVSQTEGAPLPSLVSDLTGNVQQYEAFMEALRRTSPVPVLFKPLQESLDGFLSLEDQTITIREGMSQVQTVCAAVHEITHAMLHNREREQMTAAAGDTDKESPKPKDKNTREVEAESVSYTVCQYYGIETGANSLGYIATWSRDKTLPELKASLETISKTANILITSIDRHFQEICKERGIDLTAQQPERDASTPDTPERFVSDMLDMLDSLYQAGIINRNFPPDDRDEIKANLVRTLHINPSIVRATLEQFVRQDTGAAEAKVMLERLDALMKAPEQTTPAAEQPDTAELEQAVQAEVTELQDQRKDHLDELREHFAPEDDALCDTPLDEYPLPDPAFPADELEHGYGYMGGDLLPLSRERAAVLLEQDMTVYMVQTGENPAMGFGRDDLMEQPEGMIFAVPREEWEGSPNFRQAVLHRMQRQPEREKAFLDHAADCFAIYQVRDDAALRDIRFESLDWLKSKGRAVERSNYGLVYTAPLSAFASADAALNQLWYQFNNEHPADFQHPSMSVSDIIAIKRDGVLSFHYCDSFGFQQMADFLKPENYLKNTEMAVEDDYGMIDGIINNGQRPSVAELEAQVKAGQTISLMDLADAVHREKKKSVVAQLKSQPAQERKKTAPKRSAEKER